LSFKELTYPEIQKRKPKKPPEFIDTKIVYTFDGEKVALICENCKKPLSTLNLLVLGKAQNGSFYVTHCSCGKGMWLIVQPRERV
jgi:RNase P subunit RPR2